MSGSPEAVQAPPSPASLTAATLSGVAQLPNEPGPRRSPSAISKVAWLPQGDLGQAEWLATGRRLGAIGRCSQWWIGDWIRFGASRWGERYAEAARVTGYDVASLRNMAWVASQFDLSLRSDKLTWSHHVLLAPLEPEQQRRWLDRALEQRLSVADLRLELRVARSDQEKAVAAVEAKAGSGSKAENGICPHCGHELASAAE
jgi:hypothetical protein